VRYSGQRTIGPPAVASPSHERSVTPTERYCLNAIRLGLRLDSRSRLGRRRLRIAPLLSRWLRTGR
jgi:hypothetical protein